MSSYFDLVSFRRRVEASFGWNMLVLVIEWFFLMMMEMKLPKICPQMYKNRKVYLHFNDLVFQFCILTKKQYVRFVSIESALNDIQYV